MNSSDNSSTRVRFRWYHLYFALVAFDLITILCSLYFNHRLLAIHASAVLEDQVWAERANRISELAQWADAVGAPGDEVFASRQTELEANRMREALTRFNNAMDQVEGEIAPALPTDKLRSVASYFSGVRREIANVVDRGEQIFTAFAAGDRDIAGEQMAIMDRHLNLVDEQIAALGATVRAIQSEHFQNQLQVAHSLRTFERGMACAVVLIVGMATWFGHKMAITMRRNEQEREQGVAALRVAREHLEERVAARTEELLAVNAVLQQEIEQRKQAVAAVQSAQEQVSKSARLAGMTEVATGVLHNVGNVLNSVNVSATLVRDGIARSQIQNLVKATDLLRDHAADSAAFLATDPKGQKLPGFLVKIGERLFEEQMSWQHELEGLSKNIEHIKEIVAMQQSYAKVGGMVEVREVTELLEDALRMNEAALERHGIMVVRDFRTVPPVAVDKHKVLQILINLIRNAKYAMDASGRTDRVLTLRVAAQNGRVVVEVHDNGIGISPENLTRIFQHGFTTKRDGHGFGLHSGANAAREMGGQLTVSSGGPGRGATFTLELPAATHNEIEPQSEGASDQ